MSQSNSTVSLLEKSDSGRLQVLYAVYDMLNQAEVGGLDMNLILPRVLQLAMEQLGAPSGSILVVSPASQVEHAWLIDDNDRHSSDHPLLDTVVRKGLAGWVLRHQKPVIVKNTLVDRRWIDDPGEQKTKKPWSAISVPMMARSRPIGVITITKSGEDQFGLEDKSLLMLLADQASNIVENARLFEDSQRRAIELSALVRATAAVSSSLEIQEVVQVVAEQMVGLLKVDSCAISRWDWEQNSVSLWGVFSETGWQPAGRLREEYDLADYPLTDYVLRLSQAVQVQIDSEDIDPAEKELMQTYGVQSLLLLPLMAQDRTIGLVELMAREIRAFSAQDINLVQLLSNQAAITIENARLYQETQHQLQVSNLLNHASNVVNSSLDINEIMQSLLSQMNELLHVEALSIALVDEDRRELVYEVAEGIGSDEIVGLRLPSNQGISGWVMEHGEPALVPDTTRDHRFSSHGDSRTGHDTRALICAPLKVKGEVLGTIQAINPFEGTFTKQDLNLLINLANLASSAIANAKQFAQTQAAEARYLGLFEDSIDPILLTDLEGRIVEANRPADQFLGYDLEELLQMRIQDLHPEDSELGCFRPAMIDSEQVRLFSSHAITKDKQRVPMEIHAKRINTGNSILLQWIHHDISKQVELEQMREDLMAMLFHDLQSPLGNVIASLDLLAYELPSDAEPMVLSIVDIATRSSRRLQTLIRSLLDLNRLEAGHPISERKHVKLAKLVDEAIETVAPILERREIELVHILPASLPEPFVDEDMIRRVLMNLLDNALKFSPDQSQIGLEVSWTPEAELVGFAISDQGAGIPEEYREVIFDKFRRVQVHRGGPKGLGLGLAFCRMAVVAHGGRIWVDSSESDGARFNFTLPIMPPTDES